MSGCKHLLPSSTFRAAVCVSVAVGTSLSGLGDEVVGCLAGLARVPAGASGASSVACASVFASSVFMFVASSCDFSVSMFVSSILVLLCS